MKGVELPINALIIIVLAIIVLVAIIAMFYTGIKSPQNTLSAQAALDRACMKLHNYNCNVETKTITIDDFDADMDGTLDPLSGGNFQCNPSNPDPNTHDNLRSLCACYYQITDFNTGENDCKKLCQC